MTNYKPNCVYYAYLEVLDKKGENQKYILVHNVVFYLYYHTSDLSSTLAFQCVY